MGIFKKHWILIFLILIGAFLHFYNLNWGAPYHFHPDERNVASAISQLRFPEQMNPNFFAYGSLPIYVVFFTGLYQNILHGVQPFNQISFDQAIMIGRIYSALFATALIPLIYWIIVKLTDKEKLGQLAAFLATASVGFIQFAHFGTFEMWLTFFSVLLFITVSQVVKTKKILHVSTMGLVAGILFSTKISALVLFPIPLLALLLAYKPHLILFFKKDKPARHGKNFILFLATLLLFCSITALVYVISNPFVFLDTPAFLSSIRYESSVGLNTLPVFYTQGFYETIPVLYQFLHIYPFLVNPLFTILILPSFLYLLFITFKTKNVPYFLLLSMFFILFLSQAVLFIKWTRNMVPTLPFFYLIFTLAFYHLFTNRKAILKPFVNTILIVILCVNTIFALSYFITAFVQPDTRITAVNYATQRIPGSTPILSETYDIGIIAFNPAFPNITLFNTYDLDADSPDYNKQTWQTVLENNDYIILPSQRVLQTRMLNPDRYSVGNKVYTSLFDGSAGFEKIYETPCDIFCQITYLGDPVLRYEQTANVFERPTVYIFQKTN